MKKAGIGSTVFEQNGSGDVVRDWSMWLHWGESFLQQLLPADIAQRLREAETDPWIQLTQHEQENVPIFNGKTGKMLMELQRPSNRRLSRAKACRLLAQGLDIRYNKRLVDIRVREKVKAIFADGSSYAGSLIVGADSADSFVRTWLLGKETAKCTDVPIVVYNFAAQYPADFAVWLRQQPHRLMHMANHPDQNTWYMIANLDISDPNRPETWSFQHFMNLWTDKEPPRDPKERLRHFKQLAATHAEPFRSAALAVDDNTFVPYDRLKYWAKPILWDNFQGKVTLAGDAAHPMTAHRSQNLNNAFEDAAKFVEAIEDANNNPFSTLRLAVGGYDAEMFSRGEREIAVSFEQSYANTHWNQYMNSATVVFGHLPVPRTPATDIMTKAPSL